MGKERKFYWILSQQKHLEAVKLEKYFLLLTLLRDINLKTYKILKLYKVKTPNFYKTSKLWPLSMVFSLIRHFLFLYPYLISESDLRHHGERDKLWIKVNFWLFPIFFSSDNQMWRRANEKLTSCSSGEKYEYKNFFLYMIVDFFKGVNVIHTWWVHCL